MCDVVLDFECNYAEYRQKILRYLSRLVGEFDAEDLTQEVFVKINRALPGFRGESLLSTWIYRIATNAALDRLREPDFKRTVENNPPENFEVDERGFSDQDVWDDEDTPLPEQQVFRKQRSECYQDYIENLPLSYCTVVALSEMGELSAGEIAGMLGLSRDVVKIRLQRGRAKLLRELRKNCKAEGWL